MSWVVPLADVPMPEEDVRAVLDCLAEGWLTMGPRVQRFEQAFAEHAGVPHAVAVSSGTAAVHLSLLALGVGPGDEVIVPGLTFVATVAAVRYTGAEPVLCDIVGADDFSLDPTRIEGLLSNRTKGVVAAHIMGYPARVNELLEVCDAHGLFLVEDAAQAVGAVVDGEGRLAGTRGRLGTFSFFSKGQLAIGEGGMVTTTDDKLAVCVRTLRSHAMTSMTWDRHHGHADTYDVVDIGFNYRLDEARAALGLSRLPRLEAEIAARRCFVRRYRDLLRSAPGVAVPWTDEAVERGSHFAFPILVRDRGARDHLRSTLADRGVQTTWYPAVSRLSHYAQAKGASGLQAADEVADRHCCLPLWSALGERRVDQVVEAVRAALGT